MGENDESCNWDPDCSDFDSLLQWNYNLESMMKSKLTVTGIWGHNASADPNVWGCLDKNTL
jgi:hypothetical protein